MARQLGFELKLLDSLDVLGVDREPRERPIPLTEPLDGPDADYVRHLVDTQPALVVVDLTSETLPWERWIQVMKTSAATRRIPVLAFGPHVDKNVLDAAERAGADRVVSRGKFQADLAKLIPELARSLDAEQLLIHCEGQLSDLAARGLKLLNSGEYYEAHELLEHAWMEAPELEGYLYRSLLQVSVAYLHIERGNYRGAVKMLLRLNQWLGPIPDRCRGVDVNSLKTHIAELDRELGELEASRLDELDDSLLRPVPLVG